MKKILIIASLLCSAHVSAEDWITEEVLKQLSEVRQELKTLQQEVKSLRESLAQKPAAAPTVAGGPLNIAGSPFVGDKAAKYAVVEFSDYQCPYCKRHFAQTLPDIKANYIDLGKITYVMKQFPLGFHAKAKGASIAALCMEKLKPGAYWNAHDAMFKGTTRLANEDYLALASSLNIKPAAFTSCLADSSMAKRVDEELREGASVGVSGTPAFYIGKIVDGKVVDGQLLTGARPYASFSSIIDKLLAGR